MKNFILILIFSGFFLCTSRTTVEYVRQEPVKVPVEVVLRTKTTHLRHFHSKDEYLPIPPETIAEIAKTVSDKTNVSQETITKIIYAESGYEINARHYNKNGSVDYSLFQINSCHWKEAKKMGLDLRNPYDNSKFAVYLIKIYGLTPWRYSQKNWES
jgi:soluble lytic murein transglycosylase-like protein